MDIGFLLFLNLITIPFLYEAEVLGAKIQKFPKFLDLIKLRTTRSSRWFFGYCVFLVIFSIVGLAPSESGKPHSASISSIVFSFLIQVCLWVFVAHRINKSKS